jgi:hypothetical protein
VIIRDLRPRSPSKREQEQEQQQIIQVQDMYKMQQRMSLYTQEANQKLEIEQEGQLYLGKIFGNFSNL